jgi:hypothetical protein
MPTFFNFLHLSDLHFGQKGQGPLWSNVRDSFFEDLKRLHKRAGPWDAVFFTGDLVFSGQESQWETMEGSVLNKLWQVLKELGSEKAVLLTVPGNHDLSRPGEARPSAALRQLIQKDRFDEIAHEFWTDSDGEYRQIVTKACTNYSNWSSKNPFIENISLREGLLPGDFSATLTVEKHHVGIVGINTTFLQLAEGDFRGRLAWDPVQLQAVCDDVSDWVARHDVCFLLTHQGPDWLTGKANAAYAEINPAGRFAAHLFGHMHETVVTVTSHAGGQPLRLMQACSLFGMEKFGNPPSIERRHGYTSGQIEFGAEDTTIRWWPRKATKDANGWRLVADQENGVLLEDEGTAKERISRPPKRHGGKKHSKTVVIVPPSTKRAAERIIVRAYIKAARSIWDIIDLAGLPEDDRHLAMQKFMLRQLYMPLRLLIERTLDEHSLAALEARREQQRLIAANRGPGADAAKESAERLPIGVWLRSVLPKKSAKKRKKEAVPPTAGGCAPRLVVLGDPGGGKSTLLRWLATAYLLRLEESSDFALLPDVESLPEAEWVPILVRCRELDKASVGECALEDLLRQTLPKLELASAQVGVLVEFLRQRLEDGKAILLFDGLDEITDPNLRVKFCERIEAIANSYPRAPIVATARIVGYREMRRRLGVGFAHGTLADLTPAEKDDFVRRWCDVTIADPIRRALERESLSGGIHAFDRIERLTTNPMLLTTMALVQRKVGKLPPRRHKLYWEAVDLLLRWRASPEEPPIDPDEALPQLEYIAYEMCDRGVQRLRRDEVLNCLDAMRHKYPNIRPILRRSPEAFLLQLERRTGLLTEVGEVKHNGKPTPVYEFRHLTFQEYLAALALVEGRYRGHQLGVKLADRVKPLAGNIAEVTPIKGEEPELLVSENWSETLRLCVSSCNDDDVNAVLQAILTPTAPQEARPRAILAALCLADEPNVGEGQGREILDRFSEEVKSPDGEGRVKTGLDRTAVELATTSWSRFLQNSLVKQYHLSAPEARQGPGGLVGMVRVVPRGSGEALWMEEQVALLKSKNDEQACLGALAVMEAAFEEKAVLVPGLIENLMPLTKRGPACAHAAGWALGWLAAQKKERQVTWQPLEADAGVLIEYLSLRDADPEALRWIMQVVAVGRFRKALRPCVRLLTHEKASIRLAAISAVQRIGDASAIPGLLERLQDNEKKIRAAALGALGKLGNISTTVAIQAFLSDSDESVRMAAVGALAWIKGDEVSRRLVSEDLDGSIPWIDPQVPITQDRVQEAAEAIRISAKEARQRYEAIATEFGLKLGW